MAVFAWGGAMTTGCNKDDSMTQPGNTDNIVTLTTTVNLDGVTPETRALTAAGVKTFAAGEQIAIVYMNTSDQTVKAVSEALTAGDIASGNKSATFTVTLTNPKASGSVKYIYPAAMAKADGSINYDALATQDGTLASLAANLDFALYEGSLTAEAKLPAGAVSLTNQLAICAFTLKNSNGSSEITSSITRMSIGDGTNGYTVIREAAAGPIYVAILPTASAHITINTFDGSSYHIKSLAGKTYAANNGYNISLRMTAVPQGALPGKFTVNADGHQVYFSKGNLQYTKDSGSWSFVEHQYSTVEHSFQKIGIDYAEASTVGLFGYGTSGYNRGFTAYMPYSTSETNANYYNQDLTGTADWGYNAISNGGNATGLWHTPSSAHWEYIANSRSGYRYAKAHVLSKSGVILFPDQYTHPIGLSAPIGVNIYNDDKGWSGNAYNASDWERMELAGAVFLPAAGLRYWSDFWGTYEVFVEAEAYGHYWSSTVYDASSAYYFYFCSDYLTPINNNNSRWTGQSVRLVRNVE